MCLCQFGSRTQPWEGLRAVNLERATHAFREDWSLHVAGGDRHQVEALITQSEGAFKLGAKVCEREDQRLRPVNADLDRLRERGASETRRFR
jgi:hypothetical protein